MLPFKGRILSIEQEKNWVKNKFSMNRERLDHIAAPTEICSHTSAGSQSQGSTMLCIEL